MLTRAVPATPVGRLDSLTSLRWWAAFGVFLFHMRNMVTFPPWLQWLVADGHLGVTFFFVLSGFVLTWSWRSETPVRAFYWRRFARIYPLHLLTLLVAIPVFYRVVASPEEWWIKPFDWGVLLLSVLVIQGWWLAPNVLFSGNPAAWTLTVEAFFYALHPLLVRAIVRLRTRGALLVCALIFALAMSLRAASLLWPTGPFAHVPEPIMHLPSFVLGMLFAWAYRQGWRLRVPVLIPFVGLLFWLFVSDLLASSAAEVRVSSFNPEIVALLCALIVAAAASKDIEGKRGPSVWRPFVALGEWSFAFYLIHATLMYIALEIFGPQHNSYRLTIVRCAALLTAAVLAAWLLHRFVERPLENRLRSWQDRRLARAQNQRVTHLN